MNAEGIVFYDGDGEPSLNSDDNPTDTTNTMSSNNTPVPPPQGTWTIQLNQSSCNTTGQYTTGTPGGYLTGTPYNTPTPLMGQPYPGDFGTLLACAAGHIAADEEVEYVDGVAIARCINCDARMQFPRVKGGISMLQIQTLLGVLMGLDDETAQIEGFDISEILGQYNEVREKIEAEEFAVRQARKLFDIAGEILNTKVQT